MKQSSFSIKTSKDDVKDEVSINANVLQKAGYIQKAQSGVYIFLPMGLKVVNNIIDVIRKHMNLLGAEEVFLSAIQSKELWEKTDRWSDKNVDVWFKTKLSAGGEVGLGWTHEEAVSELMTKHINSYKDLPKAIYQFQTKFRNELRAKSGIMRTREFIMKDLYSFSKDREEHNIFYEKMAEAYKNIFKDLGLGELTYRTLASGGAFAKFSDEFQAVCDNGEDVIYVDEKDKTAVNKEVYTDEILKELGKTKSDFVEKKAAEVGNIFTLGTRFSEPLSLLYKDDSGKEVPVFMGSYGIGPARLLGVIVETIAHKGKNNLVLPRSIAPFDVHIIQLAGGEKLADKLYKELQVNKCKCGIFSKMFNKCFCKNVDVLFDERELSAGEKFADADLIGVPFRVIVSGKSIKAGGVEFIDRVSSETSVVGYKKVIERLC